MKRNALITNSAIVFSFLFVLIGCGGSGTVTPNFVSVGTSRALISQQLLKDPFQRWLTHRSLSNQTSRSVEQVGVTTATSLKKLMYYIQSIQLCEGLTPSGTGYSGTEGCAYLYRNESSEDLNYYNTYSITEAKADSDTSHYIDFLDETSRQQLEQATSVSAGTYNYALINFMRPIKIEAEFVSPSRGTVHYTKSDGTIVNQGTDDGGRELESFKPTGTKTAPAQLMTYMLNNGGTWFPLLKPFVIEKSDNVVVDFVFNPDDFAKSTETSSCSEPSASGPYVWDETNCVSFDMPYAKMAPIPRKSNETTKKEVYLIEDYTTSAGAQANARIELYYVAEDSEKTIRGADSAVVMKNTATTSTINVIQTLKVTQSANEVTLYGYNSASGQIDAPTLSGLTRGANGTLTIHCLFTGGPCTRERSDLTRSYTYVGDVTVSD